MWILVIASVAGVAFAAVALGFLPPPHAEVLILIRAGAVRVQRGNLKPHAKHDIAEIVTGAGVARGFIAVTASWRVSFSRGIPADIHQRLRNVILNQDA